MPLQDDFHDPTEGHGGSSIALFLALYLLVLAFFILLVSISTIEEVKSQAAMDILTSSFTTILPPSLQLTAISNSEGDVIAGQQFQEQVTNIFSTTIQVVVEKTDIREANHPLLDRIVASLSGRPPGFRYDMEFVIGSSYEAGKIMPIGQTLEMARAGAFVRTMLERGAPPDSVAVGIQPGDPKRCSIWFYVRSSDETRLKFMPPDKGTKKGAAQ